MALIVANLLFFAFTRGWFDGVMGIRSLGDREPGRLAAQVRPESIRLLPMAAAGSGASASACYEAGPFTTAESSAIEPTLKAALPAGSWADSRSEAAGPGGTVVVSHVFRVGSADAALGARLLTLRLEPGGRTFSPCKTELR